MITGISAWVLFGVFILVDKALHAWFGYPREYPTENKKIVEIRDAGLKYWKIGSGLFAVVWLLSSAVIVVMPYVREGFLRLLQIFGVQVTQLLISLIVIALGSFAFLFKQKRLHSYGLVEVIFAAVAAVIASRQIKPNTEWAGPIASLIGCVYIVSRGLSNMRDGMKAREKKPDIRKDFRAAS